MSLEQRLSNLVQYLFVVANRGDLEHRTAWYYRQLGKPGREEKADRGELETIYFILEAGEFVERGVYTITGLTKATPHQLYSASELIRFIMQKCDYSISRDWDGVFKTRDGKVPLIITRVGILTDR